MRKAGCHAVSGWLGGQGSMCKRAQLADCSGTAGMVCGSWCCSTGAAACTKQLLSSHSPTPPPDPSSLRVSPPTFQARRRTTATVMTRSAVASACHARSSKASRVQRPMQRGSIRAAAALS